MRRYGWAHLPRARVWFTDAEVSDLFGPAVRCYPVGAGLGCVVTLVDVLTLLEPREGIEMPGALREDLLQLGADLAAEAGRIQGG